jgi:threonylcarbamoyladenosine tRNA methylthiotransferase MtaB
VLTGVDITSYGADLPGSRSSAAWSRRSCARCRLPRLRLSSIDSIEADEI